MAHQPCRSLALALLFTVLAMWFPSGASQTVLSSAPTSFLKSLRAASLAYSQSALSTPPATDANITTIEVPADGTSNTTTTTTSFGTDSTTDSAVPSGWGATGAPFAKLIPQKLGSQLSDALTAQFGAPFGAALRAATANGERSPLLHTLAQRQSSSSSAAARNLDPAGGGGALDTSVTIIAPSLVALAAALIIDFAAVLGAVSAPVQGAIQPTVQGPLQGPPQGLIQGPIQGAVQAPVQGAIQGAVQGVVQGIVQGLVSDRVAGLLALPVGQLTIGLGSTLQNRATATINGFIGLLRDIGIEGGAAAAGADVGRRLQQNGDETSGGGGGGTGTLADKVAEAYAVSQADGEAALNGMMKQIFGAVVEAAKTWDAAF